MDAAVIRIEAALQAALGSEGGSASDRARQALLGDAPAPPDAHLEKWLEAVAAELQSASGALVPDDMVEAIAARMVADPERSLGAHGNIQSNAIGNLVRSG